MYHTYEFDRQGADLKDSSIVIFMSLCTYQLLKYFSCKDQKPNTL